MSVPSAAPAAPASPFDSKESEARAPSIRKSPQRSDIQGLRAICMTQVLLYHAWRVGSPIGVDAFIMISAFLMTSSFIRRSEAGRTPFFLERWANTFKRLVPPLSIVVVLTVWASRVIMPPARFPEILAQGFASLTYWQNWRLVSVAADYYADDHALASPLQHLWSMSMQGQVFLLWPVLMTLCVLVARLIRKPVRSVAFAAFVLLAGASLAWLELATTDNGGVYFDTRSRIWEFALGSALACAQPWLGGLRNLARGSVARLLEWAGLAVLVTYSLVDIGTYPGPMAAVPMLATSAILLFPSGDHRRGASRLLSMRPLVALGDVSYAVYLIHWPLFVFYLNISGQESLGLGDGIILIVVSIALAVGLTRLVEHPIRDWRWLNATAWRKALGVVTAMACGTAPLVLWQHALDGSMTIEFNTEEHPGAAVLSNPSRLEFTEPAEPGVADLFPQRWISRLPDPCDPGYPKEFDGEDAFCSQYGDVDTASARVLVVGSSHIRHSFPQIQALAESRNWYVQASHMGFCEWGISVAYVDSCGMRNSAALAYLDSFNPDIVIALSTHTAPDSPDENLVMGFEELVRELTNRGIVVIGIRDTLRSNTDLLSCALDNPTTGPVGGCMMNRHEHQAETDPAMALDDIPGFLRIDMTDQYCAGDICPTVIGNVNVYVDVHHLTPQYQETVAPVFVQRVSAALDDLAAQGWRGNQRGLDADQPAEAEDLLAEEDPVFDTGMEDEEEEVWE